MKGLKMLEGSWILVRSENVEELLVELGISFILRQLVNCSKCSQDITIRGNEVDIIYDVGFCVNKMTLILGDTVEISRLNVKHKCYAKFEDGKFIVTQTPVNSEVKEQVIHREVIDDELVMTVYVGSVVCKRIFRRKTDSDELPMFRKTINCDRLFNMLNSDDKK